MAKTRTLQKKNFMDMFSGKQILIPIVALVLLAVFNLIADPSFYKITLDVNSAGNHVLSGYLITILDYGSELAILAIGMTLVTAASGGQDIFVGAGISENYANIKDGKKFPSWKTLVESLVPEDMDKTSILDSLKIAQIFQDNYSKESFFNIIREFKTYIIKNDIYNIIIDKELLFQFVDEASINEYYNSIKISDLSIEEESLYKLY